MITRAFFAIWFLWACVLTARAQEVKIDLGVTMFTVAPCGNWYQCTDNTPYTNRLTQPSISIAVYSGPFAGGWQVGLGYGNNRRVTDDAMVRDVDNCPIQSGCGPLSHMQGQGSMPYGFLGFRYTLDKISIELDGIAARSNYENCNYDWYGGPGYSVGPVVSCIDHQVKTALSLGLAVAYDLGNSWSISGKLLPTAANNAQPDALAPGGSTWYRPIYSSALGISPFIGIEKTF